MTVTTTLDRQYFDGNGSNKNFPFNFRFFSNDQIVVSLIGDDGSITPQTITTHYTVTGAGSAVGGTVVMVTAPSTIQTLLVQRVVPLDQPTSIRNQGAFFPQIHENVFDRMIMQIQQVAGTIGRTLVFPASDPTTSNPLLPSYVLRAGRVLAFDPTTGDPIVSNLTLAELEQQAIGAAAAAAAAEAAATAAGNSAVSSGNSASAAAGSASTASAVAASLTGAAVFLHAVEWWGGVRGAIPAGYVPADGQTLSRALYPDAWASINAGNMPMATDAVWNSTPSERGKYTVGNGTTTFRVPDYNGKFAGSIGAPFLRGDGTLSAAVAGVIQTDQLQNITAAVTIAATDGSGSNGSPTGALSSVTLGDGLGRNGGTSVNNYRYTFDASTVARTGTETRPTNVTGCFIIKLFGAVTNQGSADAALLATELATLASRVTTLENIGKPFTKEYVSPQQTIVAGGGLTLSHGLGVKPKLIKAYLVCTVATGNFAVGDETFWQLDFENANSSMVIYGFTCKRDATNLIVRLAQTAIFLQDPVTFAYIAAATVATNFKIVFEAWA